MQYHAVQRRKILNKIGPKQSFVDHVVEKRWKRIFSMLVWRTLIILVGNSFNHSNYYFQ